MRAQSLSLDPSTLSNYREIVSKHIQLDWKVVFPKNECEVPGKLTGKVLHSMTALKDDVQKVDLDTSYLNIFSINSSGEKLNYIHEKRTEPFGSLLQIKLSKPLVKGETVSIEIEYETTDQCTALQWLNPMQTAGKKYPFMFSQSEAIHARSIIPCQDTPSVKATFSANVESPLPVVMSAVPVENKSSAVSENVYEFKQEVPISSYLIAIASGNLTSAAIGPRSRVYTEPEVVEAAKWEFEVDTENFIATGERLTIPYEWGKCDVLVLPPSFPYGGMENPNLIYVTPTLLSGDRENVDVITHEIAHSWAGNLVTNATWQDMWLNEGWTVFLERRIIGKLKGFDHAEFSSIIGWEALRQSVELFNSRNIPEYTRLQPDLRNTDPDDSFSSVPYEKGYNLLRQIEKTVGGPSKFEPFIPVYFENFRYKSLDTQTFKEFLYDYFCKTQGETGKERLDSIDWNMWLNGDGMVRSENNNFSYIILLLLLIDLL